MQQENPVFVSFQRLVWTSFLSVISFQLIAPNVWGYLSKFLKLHYLDGYYIFVLAYALLLPLLIIAWLTQYRHELRACLFPLDKEDDVNALCLWFIRGLMASAILQIIEGIYFLLNPEPSIGFYVFIQFVNLFLCLYLISVGIYVSYQRVTIWLNDQQTQSTEKWRKRNLKAQYARLLSTCLCFFVLFAVVGGWYLRSYQKSLDNETERSQLENVPNGFKLLEINDSIKEANQKLLLRLGDYKMSKSKDSLIKLAGGNPKRVNYVNAGEITQLIEAGGILEAVHTNELIKWEDLIKTKNTWTKAIERISADTVKNLTYLPVIYQYSKYIEGDINSAAKANLGAHLRNSQLKILMILLFLLSCLLSLFVFLQIDHIIKTSELKRAQEEKRLNDGSEDDLINKENQQAMTGKMMDGIWLHITIAVWLLVPLFKPVENEKIDSDAPFKMMTLSRPDSPIGQIENKYEYHYVPLVIDVRVSSPNDTTIKVDFDKLLKLLEPLKADTKIIRSKVLLIQPD